MTIAEIIARAEELSEEGVVYAEKINGHFQSSSAAVVIELSDEELGMPVQEVAAIHCPGYHYFLEVFLIVDLVRDFGTAAGFKASSQVVDRIIYYAENDA